MAGYQVSKDDTINGHSEARKGLFYLSPLVNMESCQLFLHHLNTVLYLCVSDTSASSITLLISDTKRVLHVYSISNIQ